MKAAPGGYEGLVGRAGAWSKAQQSLRMLLAAGVENELRMTVSPSLVGQVTAVVDLVADLGGRALVLQRARADGTGDGFAAALARVPDWPERFEDAAARARVHGERREVAVSVRTG